MINSRDNIESTSIPSQNADGKGAVFLLDSGSTGETAPMVQLFMEKMKHEGFRSMLKDQFIKHTDACVEDFVKGNVKSLFGNLKHLSHVVLDNFKPMIPAKFPPIMAAWYRYERLLPKTLWFRRRWLYIRALPRILTKRSRH